MANINLTATNIYKSGTTTQATGYPAYFMDSSTCTQNQIMAAAAESQEDLTTLLNTYKKAVGSVSSTTTTIIGSGYITTSSYSVYMVVTNSDVTEFYISPLKTGTVSAWGTTTASLGSQATNSQKTAVECPTTFSSAGWYLIKTQVEKQFYINGTQIENLMFNGAEVEHFYINNNQVF